MRLIFLFFVLMNVIYFAWQYTQPSQTEMTMPVVDPGLDKLVLVGEGSLEVVKKSSKPKILRVEAERDTVLEEQSKQPIDPVITNSVKRESSGNECYAIGILSDEKDAKRLTEQLKKIGRSAKVTGFEGVTYLYWVYLPPKGSKEKAIQITDDLKKKGLNDYQILATEGKVNAISLGIFKFKSTALLRLKHLNRIGYKPIIEIKRRKSRQYKVIYTANSGGILSDAEWSAIQTEYPDLGMREEPCK